MIIEIDGTNVPGRRCSPNPAGEAYDNVHVGLGIHQNPVELFPGDAPSTRWRIDVRTSLAADGTIDFHGAFVHGSRGDRFLYLNWGNVGPDGTFRLFRRAKLSLSEIEPDLVMQAMQSKLATVVSPFLMVDESRQDLPRVLERISPGRSSSRG